MEKIKEYYDVIIIGGGSGGLTAAIYCGRAKLKTLVIEKSLVGGLATYTDEIANYPGFPETISGLNLMNLFQKQAKNFGVKFKLTDVKKVDFSNEIKIVETFRNIYETRCVIIATGGKPRLTGALNENNFLYDKGISFCATCDAPANIDKTVIVIGSGDSAIEEAIFLTKFAKKVYISVLHDKGIVDCHQTAKEKAFNNDKIEFIWNTEVHSFNSSKENNHLDTIILKNRKNNDLISVKIDTCFLFIGYNPNTELFKDYINLSEKNYIITNENMETNVKGIFAVGDVREKSLRQVATAVGDGAIAGYFAEQYLSDFHK